jgi:hypothetical protein
VRGAKSPADPTPPAMRPSALPGARVRGLRARGVRGSIPRHLDGGLPQEPTAPARHAREVPPPQPY